MVARLCVESSWSWIDGMLLAGCLAYGLGKFADAMGWYSRIIEVDPKSVFPPPHTQHDFISSMSVWIFLLTEFARLKPCRGYFELSGNAVVAQPS
jgi:hypothetical protein